MSERGPDLFEYVPPPSEQAQHLARVAGNIAPVIIRFVRERGVGAEFHAQELHEYVGSGVAPASADRILRHLRREEIIDYDVINRRQSLYRITGINQRSNA